MEATKIQAKIRLLQTLIQHPRTGQDERGAAERALQRLIASAQRAGTAIKANGAIDRRSYGAKYQKVRDMTLPQIAKLMREDIKLARKIGKQVAEPGAVAVIDAIGTMPAQMKVSVRSEYYSGGGAIDITVKNIPADWGFVPDPRVEGQFAPSPALAQLISELKTIHGAYNYDGSDIYTDYFDKNYYGGVDYDWRCEPVHA